MNLKNISSEEQAIVRQIHQRALNGQSIKEACEDRNFKVWRYNQIAHVLKLKISRRGRLPKSAETSPAENRASLVVARATRAVNRRLEKENTWFDESDTKTEEDHSKVAIIVCDRKNISTILEDLWK